MAKRGLTTHIPIWVRVPLIIALFLVGVLISTMFLDLGGGLGHASGDEMEMVDDSGSGGDHDSGDRSGGDQDSGGDHQSGDETD
jgi:hypothetical protein